jgi:hypothetical protein
MPLLALLAAGVCPALPWALAAAGTARGLRRFCLFFVSVNEYLKDINRARLT